jgi:hypothetical protein
MPSFEELNRWAKLHKSSLIDPKKLIQENVLYEFVEVVGCDEGPYVS